MLDESEKAEVAEGQRRYVMGMVHGLLFQGSSPSLLHVEAHHEGTQPTGDLVVRVAAFGGAFRLRLEPLEESW